MRILLTFALLMSMCIGSLSVSAQCAMCRRNVETNKEAHNNKVGTGLNSGILYLMSVPYVIGIIGVAVWMKNRKDKAARENGNES